VHAFDEILLDDRHVLVRGGVIDGLHVERLHHVAHPIFVVGVAEQGVNLHVEFAAFDDRLELTLDVVKGNLGILEQYELLRRQQYDLAA
jgi:hypothetical protein